MDMELYEAAERGDFRPFRYCQVTLDQILTVEKNTILHLFFLAQKFSKYRVESYFVDLVLNSCPTIILQKNVKGEIPLHLAARSRHPSLMNALILHMKRLSRSIADGVESATGSADQEFQLMMRIPNIEGDTALHEAARDNCLRIVRILKQEKRSNLPYTVNALGHTPLYIAARQGYSSVLAELLDGQQIVGDILSGPNGRSSLHAAVDSLNQDTVRVLLEYDSGAAYLKDKDGKTALHLAAAGGSLLIMDTIVSYCPGCCEQVDNKGWNALHYAAANRDTSIIQSSIKHKQFRMLLNDKDSIDGNTPAHLLAARGSIVPGTNWHAINNQEQNCLDIFPEEARVAARRILKIRENLGHCTPVEREYNRISNWEKARGSQLTVATLIVSLAVTAAFVFPGGLKKDDDGSELGTAILRRDGFFQMFVVTDALALFFSLSAVFLLFLLPLRQSPSRFAFLFINSAVMILCAIVALVLAFVSGSSAVLSPSDDLATISYIIGMTFFPCAFFYLLHFHD